MTSPTDEKSFLTVRQVADLLDVSQRTIWRLISFGELPSHQVRGSRRISLADCNSYIARCRRRPHTTTAKVKELKSKITVRLPYAVLRGHS
jgi:excisionase family DNA binding protein